MPLRLTSKAHSDVPLEVEGVTPEATVDKSLQEIAAIMVHHGNQRATLGDYFDLAGDPSDGQMIWEGDLCGVHWIGAKMQSGQIRIAGNAGRHVGSEMQGGEIHVEGDVGDWAGAEMRRGLIHIRGNAGHLVGAAYRGSAVGMKGGTILVHGNAGNEIGHSMRRGMIAIGGHIGDLAGMNMLAGSVLVFGDCGMRHGAGMRRGTLCFFGQQPSPLPSFRRACQYRPDAIPLMLGKLRRHGFAFNESLEMTEVVLYNGDMLEGGRGELLVRVTR